MNDIRIKLELNNLIILLIGFILMFFILLDRTIYMNLRFAIPAYLIMGISMLFFMAFFAKGGFLVNKYDNVLVVIFIYIVFLAIYAIATNVSDINYAARIAVYFFIVFLFSKLKYSPSNFFFFILPFTCLTVLLFFIWFGSFATFKYAGIFQNPNTLGIVVYILMFFHLLYLYITPYKILKFLSLILIMMNLFLLYLSTSRSVWLALVASTIVFIFYENIIRSRFIYRMFFLITLLTILVFSYFYPKLYIMELGWKINDFILNYTGKSFFTGRQDLWANIILFIETKPLLGFGLSASSKELIGTNHEAHNMYLNIILQTGFIGLVLYFIILLVIWDKLFPENIVINKHNIYLKLFPAFFAGLIVYQGFELSFIQGSYSVSLLEWVFLSMGLGLTHYNKKNQMEVLR